MLHASSLLRRVHLVLGWGVAAWLLLMAVTGMALAFKPQLKAWVAPHAETAPPRPLADALATVDTLFPGRVRLMTPASPELPLHEVIFRDAAGGAYIDPATLQVLQTWERNGRPTDVLLELHRHLLLDKAGKLPTAVFAATTLALTFIGLALALRRPGALSFRIWPLAAMPGALLAAHRNLAVALFLPLTFMAASGWALTYPKPAQKLLGQVFGDGPPPVPPAGLGEAGPVNWRAALASANAAFPNLPPRVISWPAKPQDPVTIRFRSSGEWAHKGQSTAYLAPVSGKLAGRIDGRRVGRSLQVFGGLHPLHAGHVPDGPGQFLIVGLGVGAIGIVGMGACANLIRARRPRPRRYRKSPAMAR